MNQLSGIRMGLPYFHLNRPTARTSNTASEKSGCDFIIRHCLTVVKWHSKAVEAGIDGLGRPTYEKFTASECRTSAMA